MRIAGFDVQTFMKHSIAPEVFPWGQCLASTHAPSPWEDSDCVTLTPETVFCLSLMIEQEGHGRSE
jgi:hypothetical protein